MKKVLLTIGLILILFITVLLTKTFLTPSRQITVQAESIPQIEDAVVDRLSQAIQFATVSWHDSSKIDTTAFGNFHRFLKNSFPRVHQHLNRQTFSRYGVLYTWPGSDTALKPVLLLAHMDVVPVDADKWAFAPFGGGVQDGMVHGRGTLDDKGSLMSILEAVELLLAKDIQPERTIMLAFGHDEEIGGATGAAQIAAHLKAQNITPEYVIDEGMVLTKGIVPMVTKPVAMIATSEKGYLSIKLSIDIEGGHSSMPEKETAITIMTRAITQLNENQFEPTFCDPTMQFVNYIGPEMPFAARMIFANAWLTSPIIKNIYTASASGNALMRTTTAPTIINAGMKDNVVPVYAEAIVNFRLLPTHSTDDVIAHVKNVIDDERIVVEKLDPIKEPAPVSPVETAAFATIQKTIVETFPEALVAPTLMLAGSDSRLYSIVCENIYRFAPYSLESEDLSSIHGLNEKIKIDDYKKMIEFYYRLVRNSAKAL